MSSKIMCRDLKCSCNSVCVWRGGEEGEGEGRGGGVGGRKNLLRFKLCDEKKLIHSKCTNI